MCLFAVSISYCFNILYIFFTTDYIEYTYWYWSRFYNMLLRQHCFSFKLHAMKNWLHKILLWPYIYTCITFFHFRFDVFTVTRIQLCWALIWQPVNASLLWDGDFHVLRNPQLDFVAMFTERKTPCPFSKTTLEQEKDLFNCLGTTDVYHCLLDERNRSGEICHQPIWVSKGKVQCTWKKNCVRPLITYYFLT